MKKILLVLPALLWMVSCSEARKEEAKTEVAQVEETVVEEEEAPVYPYVAGDEFDRTAAMTQEKADEMVASFDGTPTEMAFTTEITGACQKKGCWMTMDAAGKEIRVSFKDYDFFVPLDSEGHTATVNGTLYYDTLTVEQLRHYAMDANASEDSINSITEPVLTLSYEATGVYVD